MAYSNAVYFIDPDNGRDCAPITSVIASNPSGSITRMTKAAHSLRTGMFVTLSAFSTWLNAEWKITVVDADNFDLDGATWQATADASGTVTPQLTGVTVANPSGTITRCTKVGHGLPDQGYVTLSAFTAWLNAAWRITVVDADTFDLDGAVWQATADASGTVTPHRGGSFADAWRTLQYGGLAARIQPGDTMRVKASPDPTLIGDCSWTQYSKTITLPSAVTATICDCETAWTGSANITQTADTTQFKEGSKSAKSIFAAGFTTGKVAYFATGTLDLSTYQQVSFWSLSSGAVAAGALELRLCSDTAGDTPVHTIALSDTSGNWMPTTVNLGANLNSSIQSIAIYANTDPGSITFYIDNILACKAASGADALTLTSLIGKVWNLSWVASTAYAANTIRRPTQPNRNGLCYKVTAGGGGNSGATEPTWPEEIGLTVVDGALTWTCLDLEDTWYAIQSISGTTVKIDNKVSTVGSAGRGYDGDTETVATYKRETISPGGATHAILENGTAAAPTTASGGWDRTNMSVQNGETWFDGQTGTTAGLNPATSFTTYENLNFVRYNYGVYCNITSFLTIRNCHSISSTTYGLAALNSGSNALFDGLVLSMGGEGLYMLGDLGRSARRIRASSNIGSGFDQGNSTYGGYENTHEIVARNNASYGYDCTSNRETRITNLRTANNGSKGVHNASAPSLYLHNCKLDDAVEFEPLTALADFYIYSTRHDQTADNHLITTDGGTIVSATDQRHTASGISWKFRPTSTNRHALYPLHLGLKKIACAAGVPVVLSVWCRRDNTNIKGKLCVKGGQIGGVPVDVEVACEPTIDTWVQSGELSFTPTEDGVVAVTFLVWDGVDITNNFWVDDFTRVA